MRTLLLISAVLLSATACKGEDAKTDAKSDAKSDAKDGPLALTSPTLCDHAKDNGGYGTLRDEQGCIMRLDGLRMLLGDDWKTHGKCIQGADSSAAVEACLTAADEAALAKANAAAGG